MLAGGDLDPLRNGDLGAVHDPVDEQREPDGEDAEAQPDDLVAEPGYALLGTLAGAQVDDRADEEEDDRDEQERAHSGDRHEELRRPLGALREVVDGARHLEEAALVELAGSLMDPARR